jgi:hypothetical protein
MPVYQVPQFLDSGDKILGPLNVRQFVYLMVGVFLNAGLFQLVQSVFPGIDIVGFVFLIPTVALFGYLALGQYNGLDAEVYVLKVILYVLKPRIMTYRRMPYHEDLNKQFSEANFTKINEKMLQRVALKKKMESDEYYQFSKADPETKAKRIRELGVFIDRGYGNILTELGRNELVMQEKQKFLQKQKMEKNARDNSNKFMKPDILQVDDLRKQNLQNNGNQSNSVNFFELEDKDS